jgi:putative membrane protein
VPALVREVLPGFELSAIDWQPLHPRAFRRAVKPALLVAVATTLPLAGIAGWWGLAALPVTMAWMVVVTRQQIRRTAWAATDDAVIFRSGWLWRSVTVSPVVKIQTVERLESPFDRRNAMARVQIDTAGAGDRSHRVSIPYLARDTAQALHARLAVQASQTAFRW